MRVEFDKWLWEVCENSRDPHEFFQRIDLTDARCAFVDGISSLDYYKNENRI